MPDQQAAEDKPPYLSLTTLQNFLDRWNDGAIPPRIDKSALDNYSGGTQGILMTALRQIGYVDAEGRVMPALRASVTDIDARKAHLAAWARQFYAEQLGLAEQGATAGMLQESFASSGFSGSTLRKAIVFYLALVDYLGLPNSPHFRAPKQSATPSSRKRAAKAQPSPPTPSVVGAPIETVVAPKGEVTVVRIGDVGTITVYVDAQWMKLPVATITAMREAIAKLEALDDSSMAAAQ